MNEPIPNPDQVRKLDLSRAVMVIVLAESDKAEIALAVSSQIARTVGSVAASVVLTMPPGRTIANELAHWMERSEREPEIVPRFDTPEN
jgi:hypothetical protein